MKVVSLFAGCGGLDLGFEQAGFDVIWANEFDSSIHETYRLNHPHTVLNTSDIRTIRGTDVPNCDGIIGGPPCQAWSEGGKQKGLDDPRGRLFLDYIRIVADKRPKFFVIENVRGILEEQHQKSLDVFLKQLSDCGYNITYELLNAADYKIPQDRFRVFFVGIRTDIRNKFCFPEATTTTPITLRQAIGDITEVPRPFFRNTVETENIERANHDVYTGTYDSKYMSRNRVRSWNELSFTIQAQAKNIPQHPQAPKMIYNSASSRTFAKGYEQLYRRLSVRECARIQTFPDSFKIRYSRIEDGYKMIGNAVPPRLAYNIAKEIANVFSKEDKVDILNTNNRNSKFEGTSIKCLLKQAGKILFELEENEERSIIVNLRSGLQINNTIIGLIPEKNKNAFLSKKGQYYYTGNKIPKIIDFTNTFLFMPYIKGKGVRDLYIIKSAWIGEKKDIGLNGKEGELRIILKLKFLKQLFPSYMPIHLNVWHTYTYSNLQKINEIYVE